MDMTTGNSTPPEHSRERAGFTLVELLVVIVVIGILVGLGLQYANQARTRAKEIQTANNTRQIRDSLEQFNLDYKGYPFRIKAYGAREVDGGQDLLETTDTPNPSGEISMPMGLIGGRAFLDDNGNTDLRRASDVDTVEGEGHTVINPGFTDGGGGLIENKYQFFNQHSDPLLALGYLPEYPENPFMTEPSGVTNWRWQNDQLREPGDSVQTVPGEYVYTQFIDLNEAEEPMRYQEQGRTLLSASDLRRNAVTYQGTGPLADQGIEFKIDTVDSYILWGYASMPSQGAAYNAYNDSPPDDLSDLDGNGYQDTYERHALALNSVGNEGYTGGTEQSSDGGPEF